MSGHHRDASRSRLRRRRRAGSAKTSSTESTSCRSAFRRSAHAAKTSTSSSITSWFATTRGSHADPRHHRRGTKAPPRVRVAGQRARAREHDRARDGPLRRRRDRRTRSPGAPARGARLRSRCSLASGELSVKKTSAAIEEIPDPAARSRRRAATARAAAEFWRSAIGALLYKSRTTRSRICDDHRSSARRRPGPP